MLSFHKELFQPNSFGEMCCSGESYKEMQWIQTLKILRVPSSLFSYFHGQISEYAFNKCYCYIHVVQVCDKYWAGGILDGYDKEDCPIWLIPIGNFDPKGKLRKRYIITEMIKPHISKTCTVQESIKAFTAVNASVQVM